MLERLLGVRGAEAGNELEHAESRDAVARIVGQPGQCVLLRTLAGPVRKVDTNGNISTFAGGLSSGTGDCANSGTSTIGDGCPANETYLHSGYGIAIDPASGDMYISDNTGERIRKISHSTYLMSTVVDVAGTKSGLDGDLTTCSTLREQPAAGRRGR